MPGVEEDDIRHNLQHEEYLRGPTIPAAGRLLPIGRIDGFDIVLVDERIPEADRREIAYVAYVAQRTTPSYPAGYDGSTTPAGDRLVLLVAGCRVAAMALVAADRWFWRLRWAAYDKLELASDDVVEGSRPKIGRIWVAKERQRMGLARNLIQFIAARESIAVTSLGWELPLSPPGRALVRHLAPVEWLGRGDAFAVRETVGDET